MSGPRVDLALVWHFHQPDYRSPRSRKAELPWVRLHATKDYLDMVRHVARRPGVRLTLSFVPALLDQLEDVGRGGPDALFERLARPPAELDAGERVALARELVRAPRHAVERWPAYRKRCDRIASTGGAGVTEQELLDLEVWFLLAWLDPTLHAEPAAAETLARAPDFDLASRDRLLELHAHLAAQVVPEARALAALGQVELSTTPYYHPILPLLIQIDAARRARPDLALPVERWSAPADAARQIERAIARHAALFGAPPAGCWPAEGSVSPEAAELVAAAGLRWMASDEGVLWASLPAGERRREMLYRPWTLATPRGEVAFLFRDHELSDRIGFVYQRWEAAQAAQDFVDRVLRIGREHGGERPPLVTVILDGENCWEGYADDGATFLNELYGRLEATPEIRTRTVSEAIAEGGTRLPGLHSGSWIDADFHIWVGHPEKNRAWDLLGRARRALVERGATLESHPAAWESLFRAEGSDWFWWFGDDHPSLDRDTFDRLFREHVEAVYREAGLEPPAVLALPIGGRRDPTAHQPPLGLVRPVLDGRRSHFYEWSDAGHFRLAAGGTAMHRAAGLGRDLYYGFDLERFYLRLDFATREPPGAAFRLRLDFAAPRAVRIEVDGLARGERPVVEVDARGASSPFAGARCTIASVLELAIPFAALSLRVGDAVELVAQVVRDGLPIESLPPDDLIRFKVPDETFEATMWSA